MTAAAWIPILDPLDLGGWWWLTAVPMAALVSIAFKAMRVSEPRHLPRAAAVMAAQVLLALAVLAALLLVLADWVLPWFARVTDTR